MIEPSFLDELDRFRSRIKQRSTAPMTGEQESTNVGEGLTFSDYRRYSPGDDTRLLDWRVYARTDELFLKQYEEERNLTVHILLDASASMDFGEGDRNKFEFGAKLGLGYGYLVAQAHDDFRFSVFKDDLIRLDAGRSTPGEVLGVIDRLNELSVDGSADFELAFGEYSGSINTRSLVVILTDCIGQLDSLETGLASLGRNKIVLVQVLSPEELAPDVSGDTIFEDLESDKVRRTYFGGRVASVYERKIDSFVEEVASLAHDLGVSHKLISTDEDFFEAFSTIWVK